MAVPTERGEIPAVEAPEGWVIATAVYDKLPRLVVLCFPSGERAATEALHLSAGVKPLPATALSHPLLLDKWDRNCFGSWHRDRNAEETKAFPGPDGKPDRTAFYQYISDHGLGLQGADFFSCWDGVASGVGFDGIRPTLDKYRIPFQYATWLNVDYDLYNRNPLLGAFLPTGFSEIHSYYGEVPHVPSLLEDQQNATWLQTLQQAEADPLLNALLEPHGEIGPFEVDFRAQRSEPARADFTRFLQKERKYDLPALSLAWFGRRDALKSWNDVTFPDQRSFYGFTPGSQMLQGEWATHSDPERAGLAANWAAPDFADAAWRRLRLPGDQTVMFSKGATWYRFRFDVAASLRAAPKLYLSVVSLNHGFRDKPGVVFLNGKQVGEIRMVDWYAEDEGHFEVTGALQPTGNTLALLLPDGPLPGPVFLSAEPPPASFPTADPGLNMRKADYYDWVEYTVGAAMARSCSYIRTLEPDRPIKFHAVDSEWAYRTMQAYGGFGHCTGEGAFYRPFFKHFGIPRGLQASAEPGGSPSDLRGLKNLFSVIWMEGLNAFDYFYRMPDILDKPDLRAYWERWLPYMKLMGTGDVKDPSVGILWGRRSGRFEGPWMDPTRYDWNGVVMAHHRGFVYLDEGAIADGLAGQYPLLLDTGTEVWDDALSSQLEAYVRAGGTLALVSTSGRHTFLQRDAWPGARLAGCTIAGERKPGGTFTFEAAPAAFAPARRQELARLRAPLQRLPPGHPPAPRPRSSPASRKTTPPRCSAARSARARSFGPSPPAASTTRSWSSSSSRPAAPPTPPAPTGPNPSRATTAVRKCSSPPAPPTTTALSTPPGSPASRPSQSSTRSPASRLRLRSPTPGSSSPPTLSPRWRSASSPPVAR